MALLVPDNGGTSVIVRTSVGNSFQIMGPIPEGRWIDLIYVNLRVDGATTVSMAWTVSASSQAGEEAMRSGVPLITRSDVNLFGIPSVNLLFTGGETHNFVFAVGRRVGTGPSFIHTGVFLTGTVFLSLATSARILGLAVESRERLGEFEEVRLP